jgi:hypothetical protein
MLLTMMPDFEGIIKIGFLKEYVYIWMFYFMDWSVFWESELTDFMCVMYY